MRSDWWREAVGRYRGAGVKKDKTGKGACWSAGNKDGRGRYTSLGGEASEQEGGMEELCLWPITQDRFTAR